MADACLIPVCVGEYAVVLHFAPPCSITVMADTTFSTDGSAPRLISDSRQFGAAMLALLGDAVLLGEVAEPGTLRISWRSGAFVELLDSSEAYESCTVTTDGTFIVV